MATHMVTRHDRGVLFDDLVTWMGLAPVEPQIRIEEFDEDGHHVVRADIPGVDPEKDLEVMIEHGLLHVRGERRAEERDGHRSEIRYGSFERVIALPTGASPDDVTADYTDGVLTVTMPTGGPDTGITVPITQQDKTP